MKGDTASEILLKAADIIAAQPKLPKGDNASPHKGYRCIVFAIDVASPPLGIARYTAYNRITEILGNDVGIASWNDQKGTTKRKAISALKKAAKL